MKIITRKKIEYRLDRETKTAIVRDYKGESVDVRIPKYVRYRFRKYKVTEIGVKAFYDCDSLKSITIPDSITTIEHKAFCDCDSLKSITIPDNVIKIEDSAFERCVSLESITIPDGITIGEGAFFGIGLILPEKYTDDGRLIAYKAFNADMTCREFQYEEGKTYEIEGKIKRCEWGIHACTSILDVFNYYHGKIGTDIFIHEVYLSGEIDNNNNYDSKVCASKIEIGPRLNIKDINNVINN